MQRRLIWLTFAAVLAAGAAVAQTTPADRYRFEAVGGDTISRGLGVIVQVRVIGQDNMPRAKVAFTDAYIDHSPDGAPGAAFQAFAVPSNDPLTYRFRTNVPTPGRWALRLQAKIPGEAQLIPGTITFKTGDPPRPARLPGPQDVAMKRAEPLSSAPPSALAQKPQL